MPLAVGNVYNYYYAYSYPRCHYASGLLVFSANPDLA